MAGRIVAGGGRLAVAVVTIAGLTACGGPGGAGGSSSTAPPAPSSSQPPLGFRSMPSFLPTASEPVDRVVTASPGHPQLAVQGVAVQVDLPAGSVLATVTGPKVPPFVAPPPPAVTATFTVTLAHATGTVPVRLQDFTITDQLGRTFHPTFVTHESTPPATVGGGQDQTFRVTAVMPTGEGRLYWTPSGTTPVVGWDFIVEND